MRRLALFAFALIAGWGAGRAERILPSPSFAPNSGVEMRIINYYENIPPQGFLPLRVEIKNFSGARRAWQFRTVHSQFGTRSMQFIASLAVDAGGERAFELLVPVAPWSLTSARFSNLLIDVSGYAVANGTLTEHSSGSGLTPTPFLGMGEALAVKEWGPLRERLEKSHSLSLDGSAVDPRFVPGDWRGLAGFEILVFADSEWREIPASQRNAIQDWVIQGGKLVVSRSAGGDAADLPMAGALGIGEVVHWVPGEDFQDSMIQGLLGRQNPAMGSALQHYTWQWPLALSMGRPEPPVFLIMSFVVGFALVIGPLNLLAFAPQGQRHRLFWTTPAIALAASVLIGMFIVLSEGFGGRGDRFGILLNLPQLHKSAIWQEQVSRTGVLTSGAFALSEPSLILPIGLRDSPGAFSSTQQGKTYLLDGSTWSGSWFRSRSTQAQILTAVLPTRSQIHLVTSPGSAPSAVSSFEGNLAEFWYFDDDGIAWRTRNLRPGEKQSLERAEYPEFEAWWKDALRPTGFITRDRAQAFAKDKKGKFFASTAKLRPIASLDAIRWKDFGGLILGQPSR
jgi:hypothetical protein